MRKMTLEEQNARPFDNGHNRTSIGLCARCGTIMHAATAVQVRLAVKTRDSNPNLPKGSTIHVTVIICISCMETVMQTGVFRMRDGESEGETV
jgi:deoxycytidylate deaminase